jgi:hypothetical protein
MLSRYRRDAALAMISKAELMRNDERWLALASWSAIAATSMAVAVWAPYAGFVFDWGSAVRVLIACLALAGIVWFYRYRRVDARIATSLGCVIQLVAFTAVAAPLSYLAASTGKPLWDQTLYQWDQAFGLDWRAYLDFVNARPWLGVCFTVAYQSLLFQTIIAAVVLGLGGRLVECRVFVAAFILSGLISIMLSGAIPAMAMFVHLNLQPHDYANLDPAAAFVHVSHMNALRDGTMRVISLAGAEGLITFPSYHAALGVIFARAFWEVRWLRWPGLVVNAVMIAATPIDGGHYFVDVLAGIVVAVLSLAAARAIRLQAARSTPAFHPVSAAARA